MPPEKVNISFENMDFTAQKSFLKTISNNVFSNMEKGHNYVENITHISVSNIIQAIKESMFSDKNMSVMLDDFSAENITKIANNYLTAIKALLIDGEMKPNIQTKDNLEGSLGYREFVNNRFEDRILEELGQLSQEDRDSILKYQISDKDIYSNFLDSLTTSHVIGLLNGLNNDLFPKHTIIAQDHDYNPIVENKPKNSKKTLDEIAEKGVSDKALAKGLANKPKVAIPSETKKENVITFAKALKEMNDLLDSRPWYKRWFSFAHSKQKKAIEKAKTVLYSKGVSKESLDDFMKSDGDKASLENLYNVNETNINKINQRNKARLEAEIAKQEDINIKNFFEEQKISEKAQETLDKANVLTENDPMAEKKTDKERKESLEKEEAALTEKMYKRGITAKEKEEYSKQLDAYKKEIKELSNKIETHEYEGKLKEENVMDDLEFDASKDIEESSDDLQENLDAEFDIDFDKEIVDAFKQNKDEIVNENDIEFDKEISN